VSAAGATSQLTLCDEAVAVRGDELERLLDALAFGPGLQRLATNCAGFAALVEGELGEALQRERHRHA
jgi:hypothetical protein